MTRNHSDKFVWVVGLILAVSWAADNPQPAGNPRLIEAVKRRDAKAFAALLAEHVDIDAASPDGATALS